MTISQRVFAELKKQKKKQKDLAEYIGISTSAVSDWKKKGTNPSAENISAIADFLEISIDYLLTGEEHHNNANIAHSAIGAFGNHSHGTVTMNTDLTATEMKSKPNSNPEQNMSDITKEIIKISESLPMKEQVRLLNMIYDFEEQYHKSNQSISPKEEPPTFNAQSQWRIAARTMDGTYESRPATPEEIEKLKLLEDAPEPEY